MSDTNFIDLAIAGLKSAAANDPAAATEITSKLAAAGFRLPPSLAPSAPSFKGIAVGDLDPARGVYLGTIDAGESVVHAYAADDFLRDAKGQQLVLTFNEAVNELAKRNGGRSYGDGSDARIKYAIIVGDYTDGDLVLPSKELLHGRDVCETLVRPTQNIFDLMKSGKLPKIDRLPRHDDILAVVSASEHPSGHYPNLVSHVELTSGRRSFWCEKAKDYSPVVPVRHYRTLSQAPAPAIGG